MGVGELPFAYLPVETKGWLYLWCRGLAKTKNSSISPLWPGLRLWRSIHAALVKTRRVNRVTRLIYLRDY